MERKGIHGAQRDEVSDRVTLLVRDRYELRVLSERCALAAAQYLKRIRMIYFFHSLQNEKSWYLIQKRGQLARD